MKGYQIIEQLNTHADDTAREDRAEVMREAAKEIETLIKEGREACENVQAQGKVIELQAARIQKLKTAGEEIASWLRHPDMRHKMVDGGRGNLGEQSTYHRILEAWRVASTGMERGS
jgi:hypothetical protein